MNTLFKKIKLPKKNLSILIILISICNIGCDDYLEVDPPTDQIPHAIIFEDETTANAAIATLYSKLRDDVLITGNLLGLTVLFGLYSDELDYYSLPGNDLELFYSHQIIASNATVKHTWNVSYNLIYMCNAIIEGLDSSLSLSQSLKNQLKGEALFIRSLIYFYLVNMYEDIPYTTTSNHLINQHLSKTPKNQIYHYITEDLLNSRLLLEEFDFSSEKARANKFVVSSLLARIYLYQNNWELAEFYSSEVINQNSTYHLEEDINQEFKKESTSTIFQLKPKKEGDNTYEANIFLFEFGPPFLLALSPNLVNNFEEGDLRKVLWVKSITSGNQSWYMANKYKIKGNTGSSEEYSIVFRISEQLLIRAEARLNQGNINGTVEDLNKIRSRAGLSLLQSSDDLFTSLIKERNSELFCENGQRWFDLKRWGLAENELLPIKPNWRSTDILLPIPEDDLLMNPNLTPQNPGY